MSATFGSEPREFEIDWLERWSLHTPSSIAFKDGETGREYSYATMHHLSCRLATHLVERFDVRPGDRVACLAVNEFEYVPLFFAVQRLGAILVPINFRLTGREVGHILCDSAPKVLVHQEQFNGELETAGIAPEHNWTFEGAEGIATFVAREFESFTSGQAPEARFAMRARASEPCMILYTSGTTGAPKGAIITSAMLHWNSLNTTLRLNINQNDVTIGFSPFFHTGGWNVLLTPFVHRGAKTVLLKKFDAPRVLELASRERATILFGVPTTMDMISRVPGFEAVDLSALRYLVVGGEPMPVELIRTWEAKGVPVRQGYGLTEFGPNVFSLSEEDSIRKIGSIGFANFYIETRVVDDYGNDVKAGEIGELLLKGPVCTPGYWRNEEATRHTIKDGWLHTADLVRVDDEGYFYVAGRKKDMFISGGENVYPVEIERFLSTHPAIREVAVIGVADHKWGEVGKAFVALKSGARLTTDELLAFCAGSLAKYKIPKQIEFLSELPKGDSGKILKRLLTK